MPWEETEQFIRSGHRKPEEFEPESLRTLLISSEKGIKAIIGKPRGKDTTEVQSYLFDKSKDWDIEKAKDWFSQHQEGLSITEGKGDNAPKSHAHMSAPLPFKILERIVNKPLRIGGVALTTGISRNFNIYAPEELEDFSEKLVSAPVYVEHVSASNAIGKITKTEWDGQNLRYEAEIYDDEIAEKIQKGLIRHVSVGADYDRIDEVGAKVPHGLHNAELSLVAVPGVPDANIHVLERLYVKEQTFEPIIAGEYVLGFYRDVTPFMPEHFSTVWLDRENGVLALVGRLRSDPQIEKIQSIFFAKAEMWDDEKIRDWLLLHPQYMDSQGLSTPQMAPTSLNIRANPTAQEPTSPEGSKNDPRLSLLKQPKDVVSVDEAIRMIQEALPPSMVERSWGLGPQRLCQEMRGVVARLKRRKTNVQAR